MVGPLSFASAWSMTWSSSLDRVGPQPEAAVGVGELHEVRAVAERRLGEAAVVEQLLPLPDHARGTGCSG